MIIPNADLKRKYGEYGTGIYTNDKTLEEFN
jgi:hypothetical protein